MVLAFLVSLGLGVHVLLPKEEIGYSEKVLHKDEDIWIVTDLHYLSQDLFDDGEAFSYIEKTAAGKDLRYGKERMEALQRQIEQEKPKLLLVSGDLSLNGEKQSMVELADAFAAIEKLGTEVLVIPGNHDIASGWARAFKGDQQEVVEQVSAAEFAELFASFGYQQASSRDKESLSYLAKPFTNLWFLMLDSNIYADGVGQGAPTTNGRLKKKTLNWIENELKAAKAAGVRVIPVIHHNVLDQNKRHSKGFTLDNAVDVKVLFERYGIAFGFSGHTHAQNIRQEKLGQTLYTEVVNGAFSIYPAVIGKLSVSDSGVDYQKSQLDNRFFMTSEGEVNPDLQDHRTYLQAVFDHSSDLMVHRSLFDEGWYSGETADAISRFMMPINRSYFSGEKIAPDWLEQTVYPSEAYKALGQVEPKSFLLTYMEQIIARSEEQDVEQVTVEWKK